MKSDDSPGIGRVQELRPRQLQLVDTLVQPGGSILLAGSYGPATTAHLEHSGFELRAAALDVDTAAGEDEPMQPAAEAPAGTAAPPQVDRLTLRFDCLLVGATLEHVSDASLLEVLYHLRRLVSQDGTLILIVPDPVASLDLDRPGHRRAPEQYRFFLSRLGLDVVHEERVAAEDGNGEAPEVTLVFRAAGGAGLRPIETLESILVEDRKVNSYKYALLRALANLAIHRYNAVEWLADGRVALPWKLIADEWIAYYWPILEADRFVLQGQKQAEKDDFRFRSGLQKLVNSFATSGGYEAFSRARDAERLSQETEWLYRRATLQIREGIRKPVEHAGNERTNRGIFDMKRGYVFLPGALWSELSVMGRWIADSIVLRWADFTVRLQHQTPGLTREAVLALLLPNEYVDRDVGIARQAFEAWRTENRNEAIMCVWTEKAIGDFEVDHAIPFSLWGNNDLWNLLPASKDANTAKANKLPTRELIEARKDLILKAWGMLYGFEPNLFLTHAGNFTGHHLRDFGGREQDHLFSTFKDAVEYTARNRVAERWAG